MILTWSRPLMLLVVQILVLLALLFGGMAHGQSLPDPRIVIHVPSRTLSLYSGPTLVKTYPVGVGRLNFPTPEGRFHVIRMLEDPGFENPYKKPGQGRVNPGRINPLGTRWIGFLDSPIGEYGIHGTNEPASIGQLSSHGCIRMLMPDIEELYDIVDVGTPIEVSYENVLIVQQKDEIHVKVFPDTFGKGLPSLAGLRERILKRYPQAQVDDTRLTQVLKFKDRRAQTIGIATPGGPDARTATFKLRVNN